MSIYDPQNDLYPPSPWRPKMTTTPDEAQVYDSPEARAAQAAIAGQRVAVREEASPPSVVPPIGQPDKPPTSPWQPPTGLGDTDEDVDRAMKSLSEAEKRVRGQFTEPKAPDTQINPWEFALPAILGLVTGQTGYGFSTAAAGLEGALAGKTVKQQQYQKERDLYEQRVAQHMDRVAPYLTETAHQRSQDRAALSRIQFQNNQERFRESLASARLNLDELKLGNAQDLTRLRELETQIRAAHERAYESLTTGRLNEYERHNHEAERLMEELRTIERNRISGAISGKTLTTSQAATMATNFDKRIDALKTEFALETNPTRRKQLEDEIAEIQGWRTEVGKRVGTALTPSPSPTPTGKTPVPAGTVPVDAREYAGKTVTSPTGKKYRSDGQNWFEVP